jgi:hypothetical protein
MQRAARIAVMAKVAIPRTFAGMFAVCEDAYEQRLGLNFRF